MKSDTDVKLKAGRGGREEHQAPSPIVLGMTRSPGEKRADCDDTTYGWVGWVGVKRAMVIGKEGLPRLLLFNVHLLGRQIHFLARYAAKARSQNQACCDTSRI